MDNEIIAGPILAPGRFTFSIILHFTGAPYSVWARLGHNLIKWWIVGNLKSKHHKVWYFQHINSPNKYWVNSHYSSCFDNKHSQQQKNGKIFNLVFHLFPWSLPFPLSLSPFHKEDLVCIKMFHCLRIWEWEAELRTANQRQTRGKNRQVLGYTS